MPLVLKMAAPQHRRWCVLQLAKKESVTSVQRAFRTQFYSTGWFRVKLCAKCTLHSRYIIFLRSVKKIPASLLRGSHF
jgi:hypothetical protein